MQAENTKISDSFPDRLRVFRKALDISQAELGESVNRTSSTISDWEKGKSQPSLEEIELLAFRLKVTPARLAFGDLQYPEKGYEPPDIASAPFVVSEASDQPAEQEINALVQGLIKATRNRPERLGWALEQVRAHLAVPKHWAIVDSALTAGSSKPESQSDKFAQ